MFQKYLTNWGVIIILFLEDWAKYPQSIADTSTTNKTWLEMAKLYHHMGIKNHMFPLALHDPSLQGVDPFDTNIPLQTQLKIAIECKINPWYYFREIARVPAGSGEDAAPLQANRGNIALYWCFFNHVMVFLIQIRQTGKSVSVDELATYLLNIRCRNTDINLLTKDDLLRTKNIKRLKDIDVELPFYLKQRTKADANNTEQITIKSLGNTFTTHVPQASPKAADKVGRGLTSPIFFVDESPFQVNAQISIPAALSAGNNARERAAKNNEPYGTIFTTTSGKKDTKEGAYIYRLKSEAAAFVEPMFDAKNQADLETIIRKSSRSTQNTKGKGGAYRVDITLNHKQLGKTDNWLKQTIEDIAAEDPDQIDRDLFNRWTSGSVSSPLSIEVMETIRASEREASYIEISKQGYTTHWYVPENQINAQLSSGKHVLSMDTSDASGGDDISLRLIDVSDGKLIACGTYNETNIITFSQWVAEWFIRFDNVLGIIERRSTGVAVLDQLLLILPSNGIDPFVRLFNRCVNDADEEPDRFKDIQVPFARRSQDIYVRYKKYFGFATSGSGLTSRSELYSTTLQNAAKQVGDVIYDKITIDQILSLEIRNGRVDHPRGEHDDMCFIGSTLIRTDKGNRPISELKVGDLVLTREGYKPIVKLFRSKKEVITRFGLTGTPNHPFITPSGEIQFQHLKPESIVYKWNEKLSSIEERTITDILSLREPNIETTTIATTNGNLLQSHSIGKFTKILTVLFRRKKLSITKTEIISTIQSKILNVLRKQNTLNAIPCQRKNDKEEVLEEKKTTSLLNGNKKILSWLKNYGSKMEEKEIPLSNGSKRTQKSSKKIVESMDRRVEAKPLVRISSNGELTIQNSIELSVWKTVRNLLAKTWLNGEKTIQKKFRPTLNESYNCLAKHVQDGPKNEQNSEQMVYNLMVADCHEYFANDILVHNCIAFLLGHWFLTQGKNLSFYGLDIKRVLYRARQKSMKNSMSDYDFYYQEKLRKELEALLDRIKNESNQLILHKLEQQARFIGGKIDRNENETLTIEELIQQSKNQRKAAKINNYMNNNQGYRSMDTYYNDPRIVAQRYDDPTIGRIY